MTPRAILIALIASSLLAAFLAFITVKNKAPSAGGPFCEYPLPRDGDGRLLNDDYPMCEFKLRLASIVNNG